MKVKDIFNTLFKLGLSSEKAANFRVASALTYKKNIISLGTNSMKTDPFQKRFGSCDLAICLHAEVAAIKNALKILPIEELKKCSLYILRVKQTKRNGDYVTGLSKPCAGCQRAIATFGIKHVFYTEDCQNDFVCL